MKKISGLLLLACVSLSISAQTPMISSGAEINDFMKSDLSYLTEQEKRYGSIEGTPYLEDDYSLGALRYKNKKFVDILLRYNYYEGYFEYKTKDQIQYFDPRYTEVDTVWYLGSKYIYIPFETGKDVKKSYMKVLKDGKSQVLLHKEVIKLLPEQASGYEAAKPARFDPRPETYYIRIGIKPAIEFKNKKSIDDIFGDKAGLLQAYVKSEKLKFKDSEDLVKLCEYYDKQIATD